MLYSIDSKLVYFFDVHLDQLTFSLKLIGLYSSVQQISHPQQFKVQIQKFIGIKKNNRKYKKMSQFKDKKLDMKELIQELCKEIKGLTQEVFLTVWQAFRKITFQQLQLDRTIVILDSFYIQLIKQQHPKIIKVLPTSTLLAQASLNYRADDNDLSQLGTLISVTEGNLYKHIETKDKENMEISKHDAFLIYNFVFKHIKALTKKYKNISIQLDFLGTISIYERTFIHEPELKAINNQKVKIKQLLEKQSIQNCSDLKRQSIQVKSHKQLLPINQKHKHSFMNTSHFSPFRQQDLIDSSYQISERQYIEAEYNKSRLQHKKSCQILPKRPLYHDMIDTNHPQSVRIMNDLLGAGIDPLTYDYNLSRLVQNGAQLITQKFQKPEKAKTRFPALIDKFSRTIGSQLTGAKVSTSSSIRIGSNYTPTVRNFYIDLSKKQVMRVPPQITLKLQQKLQILPATEEEEYQFVIRELLSETRFKQLQKKVQLRIKTYQRYREYCLKHIPNQCVAQLGRQTLKRIVQTIKELVRGLGKSFGKATFDKLINQVNKHYYMSGKKAIVDYILKDDSQKSRTGIHILFNSVHDWGSSKKEHQQSIQVRRQNTLNKKLMLENEFLTYPQQILEIIKHSQILNDLSIFSEDLTRNVRPMNVLYYLKKHSNHLGELVNLMNQKWIKGIVEIIRKGRNWKKEPPKHFRTFINNVHTLMSNKLKQFIYKAIHQCEKLSMSYDYQLQPKYTKPILYLHLGEQNRRIIFMDDLNTIYKRQVNGLLKNIVEQMSVLVSPQCYIREGEERYLWGIDEEDEKLIKCFQYNEKVVNRNYEEIEKIKVEMKQFQKIYKCKDDLVYWAKNSFTMQELDQKLSHLKQFDEQIQQIPFFRKTLIAVIDCHDLKKKLSHQVKIMRYLLFETIETQVKKNNDAISERISRLSERISKQIKNTADYVELSKLIQAIKETELKQISGEIKLNQSTLMKLFVIDFSFVNQELLKSIYSLNKGLSALQLRVVINEQRILKQRSELQKTLKQRISSFQSLTVAQLRQINMKIDSFEIRKLYQEYLIYLQDYKQKSEKNVLEMTLLNHEEQDLKWAVSTFTSAIEIDNLITPNYELWKLLEQFDICVREWKHIELCNFVIEDCQDQINSIDAGLSKIINKLKNFSSLKIAHQFQNDLKQIISKQLPIIKIFSHPGLKQRHWHLFNKKLAIPGYDLKEITYGRIKILYDYEKNLKILTSISNQAAKQFQIQNQKNQMTMYWYSLNCEVQVDSSDEYLIFLNDDFLNRQIALVEDHLMRTILIKNSPFSKALVQMLSDWENYLTSAKNILISFKNAQEKFIFIKDIFKIEQISKHIPLENTEFESIQNIWKSVIRKVLEQPKISELFKSQKITQILEQISKKSVYIRNALPVYLHAKRVQFPRFFFLTDNDMIALFSCLNKGNEKQALKKIAEKCFNGVDSIQKLDKGYKFRSSIDSLDIIIEKQTSSKRHKIKIVQDAPLMVTQSRYHMKEEIQNLISMKNLNQNQINLTKYTLTAILTVEHVKFTQKLNEICCDRKKDTELISDQVEKLLIKYSRQLIQTIKDKMRELNINQVRKTDSVTFRKLSFIQLIENLVKRKHQFGNQYLLVPKLIFNENDPNSLLTVELHDQKLTYDFEYQGQSIHSYNIFNHDTLKMMYHTALNFNNHHGSLLQNRKSRSSVKILSQMSGRFYKSLPFVDFIGQSTNAINELLGGIVSADAWINLLMDDEKLIKIGSEALSLVAEIIEEKRGKIKTKGEYVLVRDSEILITKKAGVFFTIPFNISQKLPQRFFIDCRSISSPLQFAYADEVFSQLLLSNDEFPDWQTVSKIKLMTEFMRVSNPDEPVKITEILSMFNSITQQVEDSQMQKQQGIIMSRLLERYLISEHEEQVVRSLFKLRPKQIQTEIKLKKSQVNQKEALSALNQVELYLRQKDQALEIEGKFYDNIVVYGNFGFKTTLIQRYLKSYNFSEQNCHDMTINSSFLTQMPEISSSLLTVIRKVLKANQKLPLKSGQLINPIIFDGPVKGQGIDLILDSVNKIKQQNSSRRAKCLIECPDIESISPSTLTQLGKVYVNTVTISDKVIFEKWLQDLPLDQEEITYLKTLQLPIQHILDQTLKLKNVLPHDAKQFPKRFILISSFLRLFKIYLLNLNSKQVEALPEFDTENYIFNSMIFASYWSLGVGYCPQQNRKAFEQYIKQTFSCSYDVPNSIDENFLNQENEWVQWQNLKEQFCPEKQSQQPISSLWVPTVENTKFYTMTIKMIQNDIPILLIGGQSGKSTLLKEISSFQISYSTFIIECNQKTNPMKVNVLIRQKISYGDQKKYLLLIDDIHMPLKNYQPQTKINQLLLQLIKRSSLPNVSAYGQANVAIKKSNIIASAHDLSSGGRTALNASLTCLFGKFQPLNLRRMDEKQTEAIFRPYINFSFLHNEFNNQILKLENVIVNFVIKTVDSVKNFAKNNLKRQVSVDITDVRKIIQSVCRLTQQTIKDKFQLFKFLIFESYQLLEGKVMISEKDAINNQNGNYELLTHFKKVHEIEHTKLCNPEKSSNQFQSLLNSYIYKDLPAFEGQSSVNDFTELKRLMESHLKIKNESPELILSSEMVNEAQKMLHLLKGSPSHIIYVTPKKSGSRSLVKLVCQLKGLIYIELGAAVTAQSLVQQVIKIVKTGGKIDECICCLPNEQTRSQQFIELIDSFVSSSEFYESLTQIELQQIIKSFNSEKKILKKEIKKSQIIKKIKEKINTIFHFVVCVDRRKFSQISSQYPNMVKSSFVMVRDAWCDSTIVDVVAENSSIQKDQARKVCSVFAQIYSALKNLQVPQNPNQQSLQKIHTMEPLRLMKTYKIFSNYLDRLEQISTQPKALWEKKIIFNQLKLTQLNQEKTDFELANDKHFKEINELMALVDEKSKVLDAKKDKFKEIQEQFTVIKQTYIREKTAFFSISDTFIDAFHNKLDLEFKDCLALSINRSKDIHKNSILMKYVQTEQKLPTETFTCKQLIQCMQKTIREGFLFLSKLNPTPQSLQNQLEIAKHPIQKAYITLMLGQWKQINEYIQLFVDFGLVQKDYNIKEENYFANQSDYRQVQDQIEEIKDEIEQLSQKNSRVIELHREMLSKIQHLESVLIILKKLKTSFDSKNQHSQNQQKEQILSQNQKQGLKILFTVCVKQRITNPESQQFKTIKNVLTSLGYEINEKTVSNVLNLQEKINFDYCFSDNTFKSILNHFVLQLSPLFCVVVDPEKQMESYLKLWSKKTVTFIQTKHQDDLKNFLKNPGFLIIKNPSDQLITQLKPILEYNLEKNTSKKSTIVIDEYTLHQTTKIVFLYSSHKQIDRRINYQTEWVCELSQQRSQRHKIITNYLCKLKSTHSPEMMAQTYLQKLKQLQNLGQKMHSFVIKMKKENLQPLKIQERLEQVNLRKINIEKDIRQYRNELKQIFISKSQLSQHSQCLLQLLDNYHLQINELLLIVKKCFAQKQNDLESALQLVVDIIKNLFKPRLVSAKEIFKGINHIESHKLSGSLSPKDVVSSFKQKYPCMVQELQKVNPQHLKLLIELSTQNTVLISSEPSILKRFVIEMSRKYELAIVERKINQISSISSVSNVKILTQIKTKKDWVQLVGLIKSYNDKKLPINIVIICPEDIEIPIEARNIKEFKVSSVFTILLKLIEQNGKLYETDTRQLIEQYESKIVKSPN